MNLPEAIFKSVVVVCACAAFCTFIMAVTGAKFPWEK